jgi:hypothetical protein
MYPSRVGLASLGYWVRPTDDLQVRYRTDCSVETGTKFKCLQLKYLYSFQDAVFFGPLTTRKGIT